ncbi:MAG: hypothetical protein AB7K68_01160 [Bacteriovoracia bacterium]
MADVNSTKEEEMSDDDLDQIIQGISKEEELKSKAAVAPALNTPKKAPGLRVDQALNLELTGVINLKLCFSNGERSIEILCNEDALVCRMADGTEFRIPTGMEKKRHAA